MQVACSLTGAHPMEGRLTRTFFEDKQTLGSLTIVDDTGQQVFKSHSLELPWLNNQSQVSCIPTGSYVVVPRTSLKFGKHFHITNVPGREWILIHPGNYHTQIRGCVLIGQGLIDINGDGYRDVTSSRPTVDLLLKIAPKGFVLCVE